MVRAHVFVSGMVQMVFFRHETRVRAQGLGLTGWVKNLPDGRVEAVFEGPEDKVETMIEWCRRGPTLRRSSMSRSRRRSRNASKRSTSASKKVWVTAAAVTGAN